jgi:hypothetical protein
MFGKKGERKESAKAGKQDSLTTKEAQPPLPYKGNPRLLADLIETKKGWFGDSEKKLRKDISKRLKIAEKDALSESSLLKYLQLEPVQKAVAEIRVKRELDESKAMGKEEKRKAIIEKRLSSLPKWVEKLKDEDLKSMLLQTKKGWFGNPEKKLVKDLSKRLGTGEPLSRESLLAYVSFKDVLARMEKIRVKRAKEKAKQAKKAKKKLKKTKRSPTLKSLVAAKLTTERLLYDLLQTKKGWFGDPEKKLRKDIEKRLGIKLGDSLARDVLLSYAAFPDVSQKLEKIELSSKPEKSGSALSLPTALSESDAKLLSRLLKTQKGRFGNPEKKLKKDISKRLGVPESSSLFEKNLMLYSSLMDVQKKLESIEKSNLPSPFPKPSGAIPVREPLEAPKPLSPEVTEKADRIAALLEEQKAMEAKAAEKKAKKKKNPLARAIGAVGSIINKAFSKVAKAIITAFITILSVPLTITKLFARFAGGIVLSVSQRAGGVSPFGWKKKITELIIYSGINKTQEEVTGLVVVNGAILAGLVAAAGFFLMGMDLITVTIVSVISFAVVWIITYSLLNLMADKRTDEVESALPDVLQIVSANISAGMTPYNALWVSARKEFGALAEEIKIAQKQTLGGKAFNDALTEIGTRVRSNVLRRTLRLITQGMKAGGELPQILQGIGSDIRQMKLLQKEMAANTMSYILFIMFGMLLGAPLLFSVSIQFVDIINRFQPDTMDTDVSMQSSPGGMGGGFDMMSLGGGGCPKDFDGDGIPDDWEKEYGLNPKDPGDAHEINTDTGNTYLEDYNKEAPPLPDSCITPGYLSIFAMISLFSISFFGSLLIGLIKDGRQSAGMKLMPLLIPATLVMFWLMNAGMSMFFGSMFT